jgi:WD40 repeat protein
MQPEYKKSVCGMTLIWIITVFSLFGSSFGQSAERYLVMEGTTAQVHVFNVSDNVEVATIKAGAKPSSAVISGDGRLAFVANLNSEHISVIDFTVQAEIKPIRIIRFTQLAATPDGTTIIGGDIDDSKLKLIDAASLTITREIDLNGKFGDPGNPFDLNFGTPVLVGNSVYLNTNFGVGAVDLATGTVSLVGGAGPGNGAFNQNLAGTVDGKFIAAVRGDGLKVIDTASNAVVRGINGFFAAVAASNNTATPDVVFVVRRAAGVALFSIIDVSTGQILSDVPLPIAFADIRTAIAVNGDSTRVYLGATTGSNNLLIIDTALALSNPATAIIAQNTIGAQVKGITVGFIQIQPPSTAPTVTEVSPLLIKNNVSTTIQLSGSGFAPDAQVRIGNLEPVAAQFVSSSQLEATVPAGSAAQGAAIVVTNPNVAQGANLAQQSGILRDVFVIASPPAFQPVNQVAVASIADSTLDLLNVSTNVTVTPTIPTSPQPIGLAITPDGSRAFLNNLFAPSVVDVYNFITNSVEASVSLNGALSGIEGQTRGLVIAPRFGTGKLGAYVASSRPVAPGPDGFTLDLYVIGADPESAGFETVVATFPTGAPHPGNTSGGLAVTPDGHYAFLQSFEIGLSPQNANLVVLDLNTGVSGIIPGATLGFTGFAPELELSPDGKYLLLTADDGRIPVFDVGTDPFAPALVTTIGVVPSGGFLLPRVVGSRLYAFDPSRNLIDIFNFNPGANDFAELGAFTVPGNTSLFGNVADVTPDGNLMYCPLKEQDAVAVVDTGKVILHDPTALVTNIRTGIAPQMAAVRPGTPTPAGVNVPVQPIPEVAINFSNVTTPGATTATTTNTNPDPVPAGFSLGIPPVYYEISTTAVFSGPIQVCISYHPAQFPPPESNVRLLHDENGSFVDVTTSTDTVNHIVCGQVTHFSAFTIGVANVDFFFSSLLREINAMITDTGERQSLLAKVQAAQSSFDGKQNEAARNQLNAFENEVNAQAGKKLSSAEATKLLQMADMILTRL